jgi:catechol 2,3 dioxygenase
VTATPDRPATPWGTIAHLGTVELFTSELEGSVWFFTQFLGMTETGRCDGSVFLRTYDNYETTSLILTERAQAGMGPTALRASSPEALAHIERTLGEAGHDVSWIDGYAGHGRTLRTHDPDGHAIDVYYDTEWYDAPEHLRAALKNQPQAKPNRGVGVRRLDHVNYLAKDVLVNAEFHQQLLGARATEQIQLNSGKIAARWLTYSQKSYDAVYTEDWTGSTGRLHHVAFATDGREDILRACDLAVDNGVFIETGPHKHAIQQTFFLYVYEPGGNRIELCNPLTRLVFAPDWRLVTWTEDERKKGQAWGLKTIDSFHTHGTPLV